MRTINQYFFRHLDEIFCLFFHFPFGQDSCDLETRADCNLCLFDQVMAITFIRHVQWWGKRHVAAHTFTHIQRCSCDLEPFASGPGVIDVSKFWSGGAYLRMLSDIRQVFIKRIYLEDPMHKTITNISENIVLTGHFIKILLTLYLNLINNV